MRFASVQLEDVMLHQVSGQGSPSGGVVLSDVPSELVHGQRQYIQSRMQKALTKYARPIVEDDAPQPVPEAIRDTFLKSTNIVAASQTIAKSLQATQPSISPGGILIVARARFNSQSAVVIAKLEHELGVRAQQRVLDDGSRTFDVELLRDLLFTEGSRIFKVALFTKTNPSTPLHGFLVDNQAAGHGVAQYFLHSFLGCALADRPDRDTETFHNATENWLNAKAHPSKRGRYQIALIAEMQSPSPSLSISSFASRHIEIEDRDDFETSLQSEGVPRQAFEKDITLIANRLSQVRVDTQSGIIITAPAESYEDGRVVLLDDSRIEINDTVRRISGRGRRDRTPTSEASEDEDGNDSQ